MLDSTKIYESWQKNFWYGLVSFKRCTFGNFAISWIFLIKPHYKFTPWPRKLIFGKYAIFLHEISCHFVQSSPIFIPQKVFD